MSWFAVVGTLVVGFVGGVLSGMFGVGGAVLTTPGIRVFGATPIEAVGSTVPAIIPSAVSGTVRYARAGIVNWHLGLTCGLTGALLAVGGAAAADHVNGHLLMVFTAALLAWSGISTSSCVTTGITRSWARSGSSTGSRATRPPVMNTPAGWGASTYWLTISVNPSGWSSN